ncbi:MAG: DNA polymerase IV [Pseudomonadota bacterium]
MAMALSSDLCRICYHPENWVGDSCANCGGRRRVSHPELYELTMAHLDCDAFYASVEKRDNPELLDQPVIIGGGVRGVVSTACYIARTYGVRSAMPMFKARKACPQAVIIKPDMAKYAAVSREIRKKMRALTPLVEPLSIDEAFLDMSGTERLHGAPAAVILAKLQNEIEADLGVTASIGLSHNKFLAKLASDLDKPNGFSVIGRFETKSFLATLPVRAIWGVGNAMNARLEKDGIKTVGQLQTMDPNDLQKRYGEIGGRLARLSRGQDARSVKPQRATKSISAETTFNRDISDPRTLEDRAWGLCERVSARMKRDRWAGRVVTLKLKTAGFKTLTRRQTLAAPTNLARVLFASVKSLLHAAADGGSFRLIGVGASDLSPVGESAEADLFTEETDKIAAQEDAIDAIREKFGAEAIGAARALRSKRD